MRTFKEKKQLVVVIPNFIKLHYNTPEHNIRERVTLDVELVEEIYDLWLRGIRTTGCCSGHGDYKISYIGVVDEDIEKMEKLGYKHAPHPDPTRKDNFYPVLALKEK